MSSDMNLWPSSSGPSPNQSRQLHISHTWNDADEYKKCVCCRWWYRQVVYGCAWGWEAISEGLGDNLVGVYYFIRFSACWDYLGLLFICSTCYLLVGHMYFTCIQHHSSALSDTNKMCHSSKSLFTPQCCFSFSSTTWFRLPLLMQAPFHQDPLIGHKSLHGPYSLLNHMEHCVELYYKYLLMHLGCCAP